MTAAKHPGCARLWEVEAVRDGRLRGQDAESLRRHLDACDVCRAEDAALVALRTGFASLPAPHVDALAARRVRQRVLTDHNRWMLRQDTGKAAGTSWAAWVALAAASVLVLGALTFGYSLRGGGDTSERLGAPVVDVRAAPGAKWRRQTLSHEVRVVLEQGELTLTIRRDDPHDHVAIELPDGEIEDLGTVLTVEVSEGRTRSVRVEHGRIVLNLRGRAALDLGAGQAWQLEPPTPSEKDGAAASTATAASIATGARPRTDRDASLRPVDGRKSATQRAATASEGASVAKPAASAPPELLAGNAEDEAYLKIVELMRAGQLEAARARAKDYLLRFPNGFRRVEVLNIVAQSAP